MELGGTPSGCPVGQRRRVCSHSESPRRDLSSSVLFSELMVVVPRSASSSGSQLLGLGHLWWTGGNNEGPGSRVDGRSSTRSKTRTFTSHVAQGDWEAWLCCQSKVKTGSQSGLEPSSSLTCYCAPQYLLGLCCRNRLQLSCPGAAGAKSHCPAGSSLRGLVAFCRHMMEICN